MIALFSTRLPSERVNFLTHFAGLILWIPLTGLLAALTWGRWDRFAGALIYGAAACFLFWASAWYHKHKAAENERSWRRTLDHLAIFVMIAGTYTPVVLGWLVGPTDLIILSVQWGLTVLGLGLALFVPQRPRWIDPLLYVAMGWVAVSVIGSLWELMDRPAFWDMLAGGVLLTLGALIYAFKWPRLWPGRFGFHELFHLFILGGAGFHYALVLRALLAP